MSRGTPVESTPATAAQTFLPIRPANAGRPVIEVTDLRMTYRGSTTPAVDGVSFRVAAGEIFGFLGPNGAGKSSTQRVLTRQIRTFGGTVRVLDRDLRGWDDSFFEHIGVGFQLPAKYRAIASCFGELATSAKTLRLGGRTLDELTAPGMPPADGWGDVVWHTDIRFSAGFLEPSPACPFGSSDHAFGAGGAGGSFGFADPDLGLGYAYVPNRMGFHSSTIPANTPSAPPSTAAFAPHDLDWRPGRLSLRSRRFGEVQVRQGLGGLDVLHASGQPRLGRREVVDAYDQRAYRAHRLPVPCSDVPARSVSPSGRSCRSVDALGRGAVARVETARPHADTRAVHRATRSSRTLRAWLRSAPHEEVRRRRRRLPPGRKT